MRRTRHLAWIASVAVVSCSAEAPPGVRGTGDDPEVGAAGGQVGARSETRRPPDLAVVDQSVAAPDLLEPPLLACPFEVQEWGTFTSVQASDGTPLEGLHHEDEALPHFVHRRSFWHGYSMWGLLEDPTQQLETPVLYFFSPCRQRIAVDVRFPLGVVSQWYPAETDLVPMMGAVRDLTNGRIRWDIDVDPSVRAAEMPPVSQDEIWAPSRNVASTPVRFGDERERFIFYRGMGKFDPPVRVTQREGDRMRIRNDSRDALAQVYVLRVDGDHGTIVDVGPLGAGAEHEMAVPTAMVAQAAYVKDARRLLAAALEKSGLRRDVAQAMVDTWTRSWFYNDGLRVLYVAPRSWTDAWLPTAIQPAPMALTRTLVGRIESLLPADEAEALASVETAIRERESLELRALGRFVEARLHGVLRNAQDPALRDFLRAQIEKAHLNLP